MPAMAAARARLEVIIGLDWLPVESSRRIVHDILLQARIAEVLGLRGEAMYVTHLECSLTGECYPAGQPHNLSAAGKPLLVRYDHERARTSLTRETLAERPAGMWKWRELLPLAQGVEPVSLGEPETPIVALVNTAGRAGATSLLVKDEGRLPTGSFKARGLAMAISMARHFGIKSVALPTNGNAGAARSAYAARAGKESVGVCPAETPQINTAL